jgi:Ca2+-binding EF-hand superfamily protein
MLGERLFYHFDTLRCGSIDFEAFLGGIASYCKADEEAKNKIIFDICDNKEDLVLDEQELISAVRKN